MKQEFFLRRALTDGLHLSCVESTLHKTNYLSLFFLLELSEENAADCAVLSHLITNACEKYPNMQALKRSCAELYGTEITASTSAVGEMIVFTLSATFLKDRYSLDQTSILQNVLNYCREFLRAPLLIDGAFDPNLVELEKKNAADDARAILNDKSRLARRRHIELMYPDSPFGISASGRVQDIEALTKEGLTQAFFTKLLCAPVEAVFVGEADEALLKAALLDCFDGIRPNAAPALATPDKAPVEVRRINEEMDVAQAHLCLGFQSPITRTSDDYFAFSVANTLFGASTTSKLFLNVREKLSLCYRIHSIFEAQKGFVQIYAGIESDKRSAAEEEILRQLADTQNAVFTEEELKNAKNTLFNTYRTLTTSPDTIAAWALPRILSSRTVDPEAEMAAIDAVTPAAAAEAMSRLIPDTFYCLKKGDA